MTHSTPDSWHDVLPPEIETDTPGEVTIPVHVPHGTSVRVAIEGNGVEAVFLEQVEDNTPPQDVDGVLTGQASFQLGERDPGHYTVRAYLQDGRIVESQVTVTAQKPEAVTAEHAGRPEYGGRSWGVSTTPYAIRSRHSWGIGDFADIGDLAVTVARAGGDYLLLTPVLRTVGDVVATLGLEADGGAIVIDPRYIRPEDVRETSYLPSAQRTMLDWSSEGVRAVNEQPDAIDFDAAWENKRAALEVIHSGAWTPARRDSFERFAVRHGEALAPYIHAVVAAEVGNAAELFADFQADTTSGAAARREHSDRIAFHLWLQWVAREQLERAQRLATDAGMTIGLVHSVSGTIGGDAIPDLATFGGGIYITDPDEGADTVAAAETITSAGENGLLVFATADNRENLADLAGRGITPQITLLSEFSANEPGDLSSLPEQSMVAVALNEDPPTAGALAEEHLTLMRRLGIHGDDHEERRKVERIRTERMMDALRGANLLPDGATERQTIEGLHELLATSPARFITLTLSDAVGNRRPFALGGGYPDWAYPYTDGTGGSVLMETLAENLRFDSLLERIDAALRGE